MSSLEANRAKPERAKSVIASFTTENATETLYECPANCRARMSLLYFVNVNGNTTLNVFWYRASDTTSYYILGGKNLTTGEFFKFDNAYIVLEAGDKIQFQPTGQAAPEIDAFCTVEETFIPVG